MFIESVTVFLDGLKRCIPEDPIPRDEISHFMHNIRDLETDKVKTNIGYFFHSFKESIITQVLELIPKIQEVTILAPTHSSDVHFIQEITKILGGKIKFLIDPTRFQVHPKAKKCYEHYEVKKVTNMEHRPLHAKMYVFHTEKGDWTLYGSPNFTESALMKSVEEGGNLEAAHILPPTKRWSWKNLFKTTMNISEIAWNKIQFIVDEQETKTRKVLVEN